MESGVEGRNVAAVSDLPSVARPQKEKRHDVPAERQAFLNPVKNALWELKHSLRWKSPQDSSCCFQATAAAGFVQIPPAEAHFFIISVSAITPVVTPSSSPTPPPPI